MNGPDQIHNKKFQVAYEILRYLIKKPKAQDTVEGIIGWWLVPGPKYPESLVEKALKMLVDDGFVIAHKGRDSRTVYKLYRRRWKK
jgi:hypothetical protein